MNDHPQLAPNAGIIVVAASRGGLRAISKIAESLPADLPFAVAVVIHSSPESPRLMAGIIGEHTTLPVTYAADGERVMPAHIYLAPPDAHLVVTAPDVLGLEHGPRVHFSRPAADRLFKTAAEIYGERTIGVVLTGGDGDGTAGLSAIHEAGGIAVVQDPDTAVNPEMPRTALNCDHPDFRVPLDDIGAVLTNLSHRLSANGARP